MKVLPLHCKRRDLYVVGWPRETSKNSVPYYCFRAKYIDTQIKN